MTGATATMVVTWVARPESSKGVSAANHALRRLRACHPKTASAMGVEEPFGSYHQTFALGALKYRPGSDEQKSPRNSGCHATWHPKSVHESRNAGFSATL